ncbi:MAG: GatB/YqeY domain-containing protein [Proteobacteria bacterium]|nr:GatB/YqeY domain-containing protein [Pseudomonadota bacterium]
MSDSALKQEITEAMKDAMRARDKPRLGTIRLALSEIKRVEVDERIDPDDNRIIVILDKMVKQRRESIKMFEEAERTELADQEKFEITVLQEFLPQALSAAELDNIIQAALAESGAESMKDMGKVMGLVKPQVIGRADMGSISAKIKAALSQGASD